MSFNMPFYNLFQLKVKCKGHRLNIGCSNVINITARMKWGRLLF